MLLLNAQKRKVFYVVTQIKKESKDYVCPKCFRSPEECICSWYSNNLILIDYNLQEVIRKLNDHGMKTQDCCEGHYKDYKANIYISFIDKINSCPKEFEIEKGKIIRHIYKSNSKREFEKEKERMIKNINDWIDGIE